MSAKNEKVSYWRGLHSTIPSNIISGRILMEQDTGDVFFDYKDYNNGSLKRVQITDTSKMNISGGKFTGDVILVGDPTEPLGAVTRQYADAIDRKLDQHTDNSTIHITRAERNAWNNKVDKEYGKVLSSNNFTNLLKDKLDSVAENATYTEFEPTYHPNNSELNEFIDLGTITINNDEYKLYVPVIHNIDGNAASATRLQTARSINGVEFDGAQNVMHFATCTTSGNTATKSVYVSNFIIGTGATVYVYFRYKNKVDAPALEVEDDNDVFTSAPITYHGKPVTADELNIGLYQFIYIGGTNPRFEMVSSVNTTYGEATADKPGLLSEDDKIKLDSIEENANNYILPIASETELGGVRVDDSIPIDESGTITLDINAIIVALGYQPLSSDALDTDTILQMLEPFVGATESESGNIGLVPTPYVGDQNSFLCGDGTWKTPENASTLSLDDVQEILDDILDGTILPQDNPDATPYAVYSGDDDSLTFYQRDEMPEVGTTFNGKSVTDVFEYRGGSRDLPDAIFSTFHDAYWKRSEDDTIDIPIQDIMESVESVYTVDIVYRWPIAVYQESKWEEEGFDYYGIFTDRNEKLKHVDLGNMKPHYEVSGQAFNRTTWRDILNSMFDNDWVLETVILPEIPYLDLRSTFCNCWKLREVDFSRCSVNSSTTYPIYMNYAFYNCRSLRQLDLSVPFNNAIHFERLDHAFMGCVNLETIYVGDAYSIESYSSDDVVSTFYDCYELAGKSSGGIVYDSSRASGEYMKVFVGYLTYISDKAN